MCWSWFFADVGPALIRMAVDGYVSLMRGIGRVFAFGVAVALVSIAFGSERLPAQAATNAVGSGRSGTLQAVTMDSATDGWAVGYTGDPMFFPEKTLILHWDGGGWTKFPSPNPVGTGASSADFLYGVSAVSTSDAWAVGDYFDSATSVWHTLILQWNGSKWTRIKSPSLPGGPGQGSFLYAVSADSPSDAWAVGQWSHGTTTVTNQALVLHWDGTSWTHVVARSPGVPVPWATTHSYRFPQCPRQTFGRPATSVTPPHKPSRP